MTRLVSTILIPPSERSASVRKNVKALSTSATLILPVLTCLIMFLFMLACSSSTEMPRLGDTRPPVLTPAPSSRISLEILKNFTYWVEDFKTPAVLREGEFSNDMIHGRLIEPAAIGDLNGDGREDAAIILAISSGGTGTFFDLIALLDQGGALEQAGFAYIGDRQMINRLEIIEGQIILDYLTQPEGGPLCCPSEHRVRGYILDEEGLKPLSEQLLESPTTQATP